MNHDLITQLRAYGEQLAGDLEVAPEEHQAFVPVPRDTHPTSQPRRRWSTAVGVAAVAAVVTVLAILPIWLATRGEQQQPVVTTITSVPPTTTVPSTSVAPTPPAPAIVYSSFLGGSGADYGSVISAPDGGVYVAGHSGSRDLPWASETVRVGGGGGLSDVYLVRLDDQRRVVWSITIGGSGAERLWSGTVGPDGAVYLYGDTNSRDFPTTPGVVGPGFAGGSADAFVVKVSPDGSGLEYATYLGGSKGDYPGPHFGMAAVSVDVEGNAFVAGYTGSEDFPVTDGAFQPSFSGGDATMWSNVGANDVYLAKLNAGATSLVFSTYLGGSGDEDASGPWLDAAGNIYVAGTTTSFDFPVSANALQPTHAGAGPERMQADGWVMKLDAAGLPLWATYLGGNRIDVLSGSAVDAAGMVYVTGWTAGSFPVTAGSFQPAPGGLVDHFVAKLDPGAGQIVWSSYLGGPLGDEGDGKLVVDGDGRLILVGETAFGGYPVTGDAFDVNRGPNRDVIISVISADGSRLEFSSYLGGSRLDGTAGAQPVVGADGLLYVSGITSSGDFPTTSDALQPTIASDHDVFLTIIDLSPPR